MASFGTESLPMLKTYFFKAKARGDEREAEKLRQQIIAIKNRATPTPEDFDSGTFIGTEDDPLYVFFD